MELRLRERLDEARLTYGDLTVSGTTRRLVAHVKDLSPRQQDEIVERRGPPADRAFDADGQPTKAAAGFARSQGVQPADLEVRDNYVYAVTRLEGQPAVSILPQLIQDLLDAMQWGQDNALEQQQQELPPPPSLDRCPLRVGDRSNVLGPCL